MRLLLSFLFLVLLFSCSEDSSKKELSGPHAEVQLIYLAEGDLGVNEIKKVPFNIKKEIYSDSVLLRTLGKLEEKPSPSELDELKSSLVVEEKKETDLLEIKLYGKEQDFSLYFLEKLIEVLNEKERDDSQREAKSLVLKYEKGIDSISSLLKESVESRKSQPEDLLRLIDKYNYSKNSISEEEKKELLKTMEEVGSVDEYEKKFERIKELERMYTQMLEDRTALQIKLAGYYPQIKMIDHPRWVEN